MKKLLTLIIAIVAHTCIVAQEIQYSQSLENAAANGDAESMYLLGECYFYGTGITKDLNMAAKLYRKAADKGIASAMFRLGVCYANGNGVQQDELYAAYWYRRGAVKGNAKAMNNLGRMYFDGRVMPAYWHQGYYWYRQSALNGALSGINNSSNALRNGRGVDKDVTKSDELEKAYFMAVRDNDGDGAMDIVKRVLADDNRTDINASYHPNMTIVENSMSFTDASGDNVIDPMEKAYLNLTVRNVGNAEARGSVVQVRLDADGVFADDYALPNIPAGMQVSVKILISATRYTKDMTSDLQVSVYEPNGFGTAWSSYPVKVSSFTPPVLKISDYKLAHNGVKIMEAADLSLQLSNSSRTAAEDVSVKVELPADVYFTEGTDISSVGTIAGGGTRNLSYRIMASNNYASNIIPIKVTVTERHSSYGDTRTINLPIITGDVTESMVVESSNDIDSDIVRAKINDRRLLSDVDENIPISADKDDETFVLVIANENYRREPDVEFAHNDGNTFAMYCRHTLGISPDNIKVIEDATYNEIKNEVNWLARIADAYAGKARLIFYYAGHGVPDESTRESYILPSDGYGTDITTGYKLSSLYDTLSACNARSVMVFLDACFSGTMRSNKGKSPSRAVAIKARSAQPRGNMVVFSAAQGDETAYPYKEKYHGIFTYYLLKKLQQCNGDVTLGELGSYITDNVSKKSIVVNKKQQTPSFSASGNMGSDWKNMKIK